MTTGEKIKELRLSAHMTQEDLGRAIGVQKAAINKYETGLVVNFKRGTLAAIARALNVSPLLLMDDTDAPDLSELDLSLLNMYHSLNPRGQKLLFDRAEELKVLYGKGQEDQSDGSVQVI